MAIMTNKTFVMRLMKMLDIPTLYVMGGIGYLIDGSVQGRKGKDRTQKNSWNTSPTRKAMIYNVNTPNLRAVDCVGLVKIVYWGGCQKLPITTDQTYCGATYTPATDYSADGMYKNYTHGKSNIFKYEEMPVGALLHKSGHVGVYLGKIICQDGQIRPAAIECSPSFANSVQITYLQNLGCKDYPSRNWKDWGLLDCIDYDYDYKIDDIPEEEKPQQQAKVTTYTVQTGDNLTKIANKFKITVDDILKANPQIKNKNLIYKGQIIKIVQK